MVWLAYLGLSGAVLFAISCAVMLLGAPPKVVIELAVSTSSVMLGGAMLVNFCAVAFRRGTSQLAPDQLSALMITMPPAGKREEGPAPAHKSTGTRFLADLPRSGPQARSIGKAIPSSSERRPAKPALPRSVVLQAARPRAAHKTSWESAAR